MTHQDKENLKKQNSGTMNDEMDADSMGMQSETLTGEQGKQGRHAGSNSESENPSHARQPHQSQSGQSNRGSDSSRMDGES